MPLKEIIEEIKREVTSLNISRVEDYNLEEYEVLKEIQLENNNLIQEFQPSCDEMDSNSKVYKMKESALHLSATLIGNMQAYNTHIEEEFEQNGKIDIYVKSLKSTLLAIHQVLFNCLSFLKNSIHYDLLDYHYALLREQNNELKTRIFQVNNKYWALKSKYNSTVKELDALKERSAKAEQELFLMKQKSYEQQKIYNLLCVDSYQNKRQEIQRHSEKIDMLTDQIDALNVQ
ncbi:hypothetical protein AB837_00451 [bacterium AB1]|nr:hypothetical protein AB837_00451 [bacterium AB1]